jgi:hypothetical protein
VFPVASAFLLLLAVGLQSPVLLPVAVIALLTGLAPGLYLLRIQAAFSALLRSKLPD